MQSLHEDGAVGIARHGGMLDGRFNFGRLQVKLVLVVRLSPVSRPRQCAAPEGFIGP
jgi:hypothetical protein